MQVNNLPIVSVKPRESGKCKEHWIREDVEWVSDSLYATEEDFVHALKYLFDTGADLIAGDIVFFEGQSDCYHCSVGYFDGEKFIGLGHESEFGSIPEQFHVIENGVPIKYWEYTIASTIVHFDHTLVQEECIKNAKYEYLGDGKYGIFTTFEYPVDEKGGIKEYKIMWDYCYEDNINDSTYEIEDCSVRAQLLSKFVKALSSKDPIRFAYESEYDLPNDNILYMFI